MSDRGDQFNDRILCHSKIVNMTIKGGLTTLQTLIVKLKRRGREMDVAVESVDCTVDGAEENLHERKRRSDWCKAIALRRIIKDDSKRGRSSERLDGQR